MSYQVTARKWRPLTFDDVVGQQHVSNTLRNAISQGRLAHAFIFSGTRGCGKTTTARILARAVNCLNPQNFEPCNECEICREIIDGRSLDVIEIDGASNRGVEEIRNLRESVRYAPARAKKKVYIIDEVHMLTKEAFNALLKTLEEPPPHVLFIFATTEIHKVPATILSRCQRYDFRRITIEEIIGRLTFIAQQEKINIDNDALLMIAKKGDGSMRDAQSIFDQVVSFCGMTISGKDVAEALNIVDLELFFRVSEIVKQHDTPGSIALVDEVIKNGYDIKEFVGGIAEHFRNILIAKTTGNTKLLEEPEPFRLRYAADAEEFSLNDLLRIIKMVTDTENSIRYAVQPRFKLEVLMIQLTKMDQSIQIEMLLEKIERLSPETLPEKKKVQPVSVAASPAVQIPKQLSSSAPPILGESRKTYSISTAKKTNGEPPVSSSSSGAVSLTSISINEIQNSWNVIRDEMRKKRISVGTVLGESKPIEIINGVLKIATNNEFHRTTLQRSKDDLEGLINSYFKTKLRIDPFIGEAGIQQTPKPAQEIKTNAEILSPSSNIEEHPLIKTLYKDFGAERI
ncbi:MAG: DNA polymerase III subunit gamma/tau [Bacteroidetes bacterium]|nr:DNA polymerase III subunit gamma/tau [Bacteroidota bacterium]